MSDLVPADRIEGIVGAPRHTTLHLGRVVTAEQTAFILHSKACLDSGIDLRECEYSRALDRGIKADAWAAHENRTVALAVRTGASLADVTLIPRCDWPTKSGLAIVDDVVAALSNRRYRYASEVALHAGLSEALTEAGIDHEREVQVAGGRIDFLIGSLGVEVKIKGSTEALGRQLARYAADPRIEALLVVTSRPSHRQVRSIAIGVPIRVVTIGALGL